jgi:hypothetical protein
LTKNSYAGRNAALRRLASVSVALVCASGIALGPSLARAQEAPTPVCPNGYVWDQAAGRCQAPAAGYATPMQQTTQSTYVPQSVAMSGPRMIKDWQDGDPVPDGYRVTQRKRVGLIVGGAVTFGVLYLFSVLGAAIVRDANNVVGGKDNADALFIPGVGPFVQMTTTTSATGNVFNVIDGAGQCAGLAMLFVGLTSPKQVLVRSDLGRSVILPTPYIGRGGGGIGLVGLF